MMTEDSVDKAEAWDALAEKNTIIASLTAERDALRARVEELEEALKPFAAIVEEMERWDTHTDMPDSQGWYGLNRVMVTLGDLRRACDTMEASDG